MRRFNVEMVVGLFMIAGFLCFAWLSIQLGDIDVFGPKTYTVTAKFGSVSGLKDGAIVEIAGVQVGKVTDITFDPTATLISRREVLTSCSVMAAASTRPSRR